METTLCDKLESENPDLVFAFLIFENMDLEAKSMNHKLNTNQLASAFSALFDRMEPDSAMHIMTAMALAFSQKHGGMTTGDNHG